MKFSYNWLQDFFEDALPDPKTCADLLGTHSFEIEEVEDIGTDTIIDIDVLPNRSSDCLSYQGMARELSALTGLAYRPFKQPIEEYLQSADQDEKEEFSYTEYIDFGEPDRSYVPRMTKRIAKGITVKPSANWLAERLVSIGQKPINNVVDITNYVMWVTGQPVHAFDYDKLSGEDGTKKMSVRLAKEEETLVDLTGLEHVLDSTMLVIADSKQALDVAGVKGGADSGVSETTRTIVLSACNYDYQSIRNTTKTLKLHTDASKRYENQVPLFKASDAQALLAYLIETECGGTVSQDLFDTNPDCLERWQVQLSRSYVNSLLGVDLDTARMAELLASIGLACTIGQGILTVTVDSSRPDLKIPADIAEEIGRLYGYVNIEPRPISEGAVLPAKNTLVQARNKTTDLLRALGMSQTNSRSLVSDGVVKLANSLNSNADSLRIALQPLLREKIEKNFVHTESPAFFEIGKVFTGQSGQSHANSSGVQEHWSFAGMIGKRKIKEKQKNDLFLQTKGILESVFGVLQVRGIEWKETSAIDSESAVAILEIDGDILGSVGINWWELNFEELVAAIDTTVRYKTPSRYPKMGRDVSVFVPLEARVRDVREIIESAGAEKCIETSLFDVYEDQEHGRKSIGFRLIFQCYDTTLSDEWTNEQMQKIYAALSKQEGYEIR